MKRADLPTGCDSFVSSLTFSSYYAASSTSGIFTAGLLKTFVNHIHSLLHNRRFESKYNILICQIGFGDGSVKLFDIRTPDAGVATFSDLESKILECRLQVRI